MYMLKDNETNLKNHSEIKFIIHVFIILYVCMIYAWCMKTLFILYCNKNLINNTIILAFVLLNFLLYSLFFDFMHFINEIHIFTNLTEFPN